MAGVSIAPGKKVPLTRHGFKDATTDEKQIRAWWKRWPNANIGAPTGIAFDVIDVEVEHLADFLEYWQQLAPKDDISQRPSVRTPSGGLHIYVATSGLRNASA